MTSSTWSESAAYAAHGATIAQVASSTALRRAHPWVRIMSSPVVLLALVTAPLQANCPTCVGNQSLFVQLVNF
jgi:hypothetical protein